MGKHSYNIDAITGGISYDFSVDATGNRLSQQDQSGTEAYSYPASTHRLTQLGAQ